MTAQPVISRVRDLLSDGNAPYRWEDTELFRWLSDGIVDVIGRRPDAQFTDAFTLATVEDITALTDELPVSDTFREPLSLYVAAMAFGDDAEHANNGARSLALFQQYEAWFVK